MFDLQFKLARAEFHFRRLEGGVLIVVNHVPQIFGVRLPTDLSERIWTILSFTLRLDVFVGVLDEFQCSGIRRRSPLAKSAHRDRGQDNHPFKQRGSEFHARRRTDLLDGTDNPEFGGGFNPLGEKSKIQVLRLRLQLRRDRVGTEWRRASTRRNFQRTKRGGACSVFRIP